MNAWSCFFVLRLWCRSWLVGRQTQFILITVVVILLWLLDLRIMKQFEPFSTLSDIRFVRSNVEDWIFHSESTELDGTTVNND